MTKKPEPVSKKGDFKRGKRGFVQTGGLLGDRIRKAGEKRGFSEMRLLTHWVEIVGQSIASIALPMKVSYAREGIGATLVVLSDGARAPELQMMLPELREKVNACYGYNAISRIRITQTSAAGFAEDHAEFLHKPKKAKPLSSKKAKELETALKPITDDKLRSALEKLGNNVLNRN